VSPDNGFSYKAKLERVESLLAVLVEPQTREFYEVEENARLLESREVMSC
jgi:hypothetical protein